MKEKVLSWLKARKEQLLSAYDDASQISQEAFEELRDRFGGTPVLVMQFVLLAMSFVCLVLLIDLVLQMFEETFNKHPSPVVLAAADVVKGGVKLSAVCSKYEVVEKDVIQYIIEQAEYDGYNSTLNNS